VQNRPSPARKESTSMISKIAILIAAALSGLTAQSLPSKTTTGAVAVGRSAVAGKSGSFSASAVEAIKNKARTFGDQVSASGTRYSAVIEQDLLGKSPADALRALTPTVVKEGDGVNRMEVVVELRHPLFVEAKPGEPVAIGTVTIEAGAARHIDVQTDIDVKQITVIGK